jgi:hypothetical protein
MGKQGKRWLHLLEVLIEGGDDLLFHHVNIQVLGINVYCSQQHQ